MPEPTARSPRPHQPFDQPDGYSGQAYTVAEERAIASPEPDPLPVERGDIPPEAGQRARADPRTGEVHGSGTGIGGGSPGEDFDSSGASGDSYPVTGGERGDQPD